MKLPMRVLAAAVLVCASLSAVASIKSRTDTNTVVLKRGGVVVASHDTIDSCDIDKATREAAEGATRTSGKATYECIESHKSALTFGKNPPCPAAPAPEAKVVDCPAGTTGAYTQTRAFVGAPYPQCWIPGPTWVPVDPPASCRPIDTDGDGVPDVGDACPTVHASTPDGCPASPPPDTEAPTVGTLTAAASSSTQIRVTWPAATDNVGVTGYELQNCRGVTCENFATLWTGTAIEYLHTVPVGSTTRFRHRARDAAGNWSAFSNVPTVTTTAPPPAGNNVLLTWTTPTQPEPVSAYRVVWGASPDEMINTVQIAPAQSYTLSGLADGTWHAAVAVVLSGGNAAQSNTKEIVVPRDQTVAITWPSAPPPSAALFRDDFEFNASRAGAASSVFTSRGWTHIKSTNTDMRRGSGYLYTQPDAAVGSRVLVFESKPSEGGDLGPGFPGGQTDYYLQFGIESAPTTTIPANVWFQFRTYATTESRFDRDKVLYPCRTAYSCSTLGGSLAWMFLWGSGGFEGVSGPLANRYIGVIAEHADWRGDAEYPTNKGKLFQNVSKAQLVGGRWYDLRLHFDTSGAQGVYQAWIRERGQSAWTQVADWRGGVTPNFTWPIPADQRIGHRVMRTPTTVNGRQGDSTTYMDDFVMTSSQSDLPN